MFKFSLQRVLELREKREQAVAVQLAAARMSAEAARNECERLEQARLDGVRQLTHAQAGAQTAGHLRNVGFLLSCLDEQIQRARVAVQEAEADVARRMTDFATACQERQMLDRLRDKHLATWRSEELQADQSKMDAVALTRFARAGSARGDAPENG